MTGGNALIGNVVVIDGQLVGSWKRSLGSDAVTVGVSLLTRASKPEERAIRSAIDAYSAFLGVPVRLSVTRR